ncbi:dolichyl-phosphate mannose synthase [Microbacterium sp. HM58-2]|nr:dolichyl-phosphate mannose synthase [Microbacterium sp. HM58-2]
MGAGENRVLVVVPAWNEQESVAGVVRDVASAMPEAVCVVVDDGSSDRTSETARRAGAIVLTLPFNLGVGGAMRTGFRYARDNGFGVVVQVDADGQHDPTAIPALIDGLRDADLVIGARFAGVGDYRVMGPRRWAMRLLAVVLSRVSHTRLTDVTSGFKASGPRAVALFADNFPAEYLGDTIEALVIAARAGLRIRQLPVDMRVRQGGEPSHHPLKAGVYLVRACAAFLLAMMRPRTVLEER